MPLVKATLCKTVLDCLPGNDSFRLSSKVTSKLRSRSPPMPLRLMPSSNPLRYRCSVVTLDDLSGDNTTRYKIVYYGSLLRKEATAVS
ncbi:hypothetical protein TNCV_1244801 [Trichonephila clavipes]|nr:hypothetical protein TNCV_1244801 [Trichonephila clavipes]